MTAWGNHSKSTRLARRCENHSCARFRGCEKSGFIRLLRTARPGAKRIRVRPGADAIASAWDGAQFGEKVKEWIDHASGWDRSIT